MQDADFIEDARSQKFGLKPKSGAYLDALIKKIYETPAAVFARVGPLLK
jgi:hypothetical protein